MCFYEHMKSNEEQLQADGARADVAKRVARGYAQLRGVLVQRASGAERASTVGKLVTARQHRALVLYITLLWNWPWLQKERVPLDAAVWLRLLYTSTGLTWSESTLSRTWKFLVGQGLVGKKRVAGGLLRVWPRREDGDADYAAPSGATNDWNEAYFVLPGRFWMSEDFAHLGMAGLAMLLIILKETNKKSEVKFTLDQAAGWYGFSRGTVKAGLDQLTARSLLLTRVEWIDAPLSKINKTAVHWYSLADAYSTAERNKARRSAQRARARKEAPSFQTEDGGTDVDP
jgi:hypothetical protein